MLRRGPPRLEQSDRLGVRLEPLFICFLVRARAARGRLYSAQGYLQPAALGAGSQIRGTSAATLAPVGARFQHAHQPQEHKAATHPSGSDRRAEGSESAPPRGAVRIEPSATLGEGIRSRRRAPEQGHRRSLTCTGVSVSPPAARLFTKHARSAASVTACAV
ncbi:hypothetical protein NDU88_000359 [Pleurodeles waltl]|uniref:Uncharacterized protein n=1 Tax=Pleurodeles waltl TaxID=8319 RepID=A0AAV7U4D8_PLEWA|nr:hypothetical protein NDU88_000359 [Pleurodeles waltl]